MKALNVWDRVALFVALLVYGVLCGFPLYAQIGSGVGTSAPPQNFDAAQLTGEIDDARLSDNVALKDGVTFSGDVTLGANLAPDTDSSRSLGTTSVRFSDVFTDELNSIAVTDFARLSQTNIFSRTASNNLNLFTTTNKASWAGIIAGNAGDGVTNGMEVGFSGSEASFEAGNGWLFTPSGVDLVIYAGGSKRAEITSAGVFEYGGVEVATQESGSFVASFTNACTTTPTITFDWTRSGNIAAVKAVAFSGMSCTSDSTQFSTTGTPVPTTIRPSVVSAISPLMAGDGTNNGDPTDICMEIGTDGNVYIDRPTTAGSACTLIGWTSSGDKSAHPTAQGFSYLLGNPD